MQSMKALAKNNTADILAHAGELSELCSLLVRSGTFPEKVSLRSLVWYW